jgi:hypothetical protein
MVRDAHLLQGGDQGCIAQPSAKGLLIKQKDGWGNTTPA